MSIQHKKYWLTAGCLVSALAISNISSAALDMPELDASELSLDVLESASFKVHPLVSALQNSEKVARDDQFKTMRKMGRAAQPMDCSELSNIAQSITQEETMNGIRYGLPELSDSSDQSEAMFQAFQYLAQITGSEIEGNTNRVMDLPDSTREALGNALESLIGELVSCHFSTGAMIESPSPRISIADAFLAKAIGVTLFAPYKTQIQEMKQGVGEGSLFNEEVGPWQEALADLINSIGGVPSNVIKLIKYRVENPQETLRGMNIHYFDGPGIKWQPMILANFFRADSQSVDFVRQILSRSTHGRCPPVEPPVEPPVGEPPVEPPVEEPPVEPPVGEPPVEPPVEEPPVEPPVGEPPVEPPVGEPPVEPPVGEPPVEPPVGEPPVEPPVGEPPVEPPVGEPPVEPPVGEPPVEPPVGEPPVEPPVGEPPVEPPVEEPPVEPPVNQPPIEQPPVTGGCELTADQQALLDAHNEARSSARSCGGQNYPAAAPLTWSCTLGQAATSHTQDMIDNNFFSHTGSDGSSHADRIGRLGYSYRATGENIAMGQMSVDSAMSSWLGSPGHCRGIMNPAYTELGAARIRGGSRNRDHWTAVFATPR